MAERGMTSSLTGLGWARQENTWLLVMMHTSSAAGLYVRSSIQLVSHAVLTLSLLTLYSLYQYAYSPNCSLHKL